MSTSTRGRSVGLIVALASGAAAISGCDQGTAAPPPPAAAAAPANAPPTAVPTAPGSAGPLSKMRDNPTSQMGRSAKLAKDTVQMAMNRDSAIGGMASELSGEAEALDIGGLRWSVPTWWQPVRGDTPMRAAEYRIPHPEGGEGEAQIIWFYFGPGQGGSIANNVARWSTLVRDAAGNPAEPDIVQMKINGIPATLVAMEGTYRDGIPGETYVERPNYHFYGAIFEGPNGNVFIRVTGPADLMQWIVDDWQQLFQGTRRDNM